MKESKKSERTKQEILKKLRIFQAEKGLANEEIAILLGITGAYLSFIHSARRSLTNDLGQKILEMIDELKDSTELSIIRNHKESFSEFRARKNANTRKLCKQLKYNNKK